MWKKSAAQKIGPNLTETKIGGLLQFFKIKIFTKTFTACVRSFIRSLLQNLGSLGRYRETVKANGSITSLWRNKEQILVIGCRNDPGSTKNNFVLICDKAG